MTRGPAALWARSPMPLLSCLAAAWLASSSVTRIASATAESSVVRQEVTIEGVAGRVVRAQLVVPENPARPERRSITLTALVLAASEPNAHQDPVLVFQGGPGQSATELASFYATFLSEVRKHRDIVLLDQRGTGQSHALPARVVPERLLDDLGAIAPPSWIEPTLAALRDSADLTQYTTARIAEDADRFLDALGYSQVNLYGTSYGTRCAQEFMRRYPKRVRSVVIKNVLPMRALIPLSYGANAERAWRLLLADVSADSAARARYPDLQTKLDSLLARLAARPVRVAATNPVTRQPQDVELTRDGVAMTIRMLLMSPSSRATVPYLIDRAASGAFDELVTRMVQTRVAYARTLSLGMSLSVVAAEDCPRMTPQLVELDTRGSFMGRAALLSFDRGCELWPRGAVPRHVSEPVRSRIPTLVVSGRLDPATPPEWGEEVAHGLRNAKHVVFRYAAHPNAGFNGLDELVARFIESGSVKGLDVSCAERGETAAFQLAEKP